MANKPRIKTQMLLAAKEIEQAGVDLFDHLCRKNEHFPCQTTEISVEYLKSISSSLKQAGKLMEKVVLWKFEEKE